MNNLMDAWAKTSVLDKGQTKPRDMARPGDVCEVSGCGHVFAAREIYFHTVQEPRTAGGHEPWVCWKHVTTEARYVPTEQGE